VEIKKRLKLKITAKIKRQKKIDHPDQRSLTNGMFKMQKSPCPKPLPNIFHLPNPSLLFVNIYL
jgi:hypothetical protein